MLVGDWLQSKTNLLKQANIPLPRLDLLVLLEDFTGKDRSWLLANFDKNLNGLLESHEVNLQLLNNLVRRRAKNEPLSYIRHRTEFYGRDFFIDRRVLEPRPESETIIDLLKKYLAEDNRLVEKNTRLAIDVGTGSGALAITAAMEIPKLKLIATDIDKKCLAVTKINAARYKKPIEMIEGDLVLPFVFNRRELLNNNQYILLCNLPYVPEDFPLNAAAMYEPPLAIFGGKDGLSLYRTLFDQIRSLYYKPKLILTESLPAQHKSLASIAKTSGYKLVETCDFIQLFSPLEQHQGQL